MSGKEIQSAEEGGVTLGETETSMPVKTLETEKASTAVGSNDSWTKDLCGFRSEDPTRKRNAWIGCGVCSFVFLAIALPILFLVIIPAVVRDLAEQSDLVITEALIIGPRNDKFRARVTQKLENTGTENAFEIQMKDLDLSWLGSNLVTLTDCSSMDVKEGRSVTLTATAVVDDIAALTLFNIYLLALDDFKWGVDGSADINIGTGDIGVDVDKTVDMKGFHHFPIDTIIEEIVITGGTPSVIINFIDATFYNPSTIGIDFQQDVHFFITSFGVRIGVATITDFYLRTGTFLVPAAVNMTFSNDEEYHQLMKVVANHTMGLNAPIEMVQFSTETPVTWLAPGLSYIDLASFIPGAEQLLIANIDMYPSAIHPTVMPFTMYLNNPIDTELHLFYLQADIYVGAVLIAVVDEAVDITIPARSSVTTPFINATVLHSTGAHTVVLLNIESKLTGAIDQFPTFINYTQANVLAYIHLP